MSTPPVPGADPTLPPRSRGVIALLEENCTVCMICARECPVWCIHIDSHTETEPGTDGQGRDRTYNMLDVFDIDYGVCMYCGICVEACPFDALHWSPELAEPESYAGGLVHDRDRLRGWLPVVPPPPALDPHAEEPKEVETARRITGR